MSFALESPAFVDGQTIPARYTCDGENLSPPLAWREPPPGTRSFVLIVEDPDAPSGTFRHWAIYNIPVDRRQLPEGIGSRADADGLEQSVNDFGHARYDGPCPPPGHGVHHYHFRLGALDTDKLSPPRGASVSQVWDAARPHLLGEAALVGLYKG